MIIIRLRVILGFMDPPIKCSLSYLLPRYVGQGYAATHQGAVREQAFHPRLLTHKVESA